MGESVLGANAVNPLDPLNAVDVWVLPTSELAGVDLVAACTALLSPEEAARKERYIFEKNRHELLATRSLCRAVLGSYLGEPPAALTFRANEYGRPELEPPGDLSFNLTNTVHLVACAVGRGRIVGVDTEPVDRAESILEIAATVFTERERAELQALDDGARKMRAVLLWTAKEAYMKARGMGMSLSPKGFEIVFEGPRSELRFVRDLGDDPARWELASFETDGHVITTCIELRGLATVPVTLRRADLRALLGVGVGVV